MESDCPVQVPSANGALCCLLGTSCELTVVFLPSCHYLDVLERQLLSSNAKASLHCLDTNYLHFPWKIELDFISKLGL